MCANYTLVHTKREKHPASTTTNQRISASTAGQHHRRLPPFSDRFSQEKREERRGIFYALLPPLTCAIVAIAIIRPSVF